jgi:hypothetical protein
MFPAPVTKPLENYYPGISIRDYFAAKAMQGLIGGIESGKEHQIALVPSTAYAMADEMLKAREA